MPEISRFYGIVIKMYFSQNEHNPPHIHIIYGKYVAAMDIKNLEIIDGKIPEKAYNLVKEWVEIHKKEILSIWNSQQFKKITPLE